MSKKTNFFFILFLIFSLYAKAQNQEFEINTIFPIGDKIKSENFTGSPWVKRLFANDSNFNCSVGNVTFEPQTRSNWHKHPAGQILLALNGVGYYQERGKTLRILRPGDVAKCPPNVEHWHGASHDEGFVQLAITAQHPKGRVIWLEPVSDKEYQIGYTTKQLQESSKFLSNRHRYFTLISSFTAKGNLEKLKLVLNAALDEGLSINEIKEVLLHLSAYCGFPRSIQGLKTFLSVVDERKSKGLKDNVGKTATPIDNTTTKYDRGKKVLEKLTGIPYSPPTSGYRAFSPEMDTFLKEHLFADIFERDILSYQDREITTISALINLGSVEPMMRGHMGIALNIGITELQIQEILNIIEYNIGKKEAERGRNIFAKISTKNKK